MLNSEYVHCFNPFMPNGISHYYQLKQSISVLRDVRWYFSFLFKLSKQTVDTVLGCNILSGSALFAYGPEKGR